jgi:hypothetical protein
MADDKHASWWRTVPGVVTSSAAMLTAITGLVLALDQLGYLRAQKDIAPPSTENHGPEPVPTPEPASATIGTVSELANTLTIRQLAFFQGECPTPSESVPEVQAKRFFTNDEVLDSRWFLHIEFPRTARAMRFRIWAPLNATGGNLSWSSGDVDIREGLTRAWICSERPSYRGLPFEPAAYPVTFFIRGPDDADRVVDTINFDLRAN